MEEMIIAWSVTSGAGASIFDPIPKAVPYKAIMLTSVLPNKLLSFVWGMLLSGVLMLPV